MRHQCVTREPMFEMPIPMYLRSSGSSGNEFFLHLHLKSWSYLDSCCRVNISPKKIFHLQVTAIETQLQLLYLFIYFYLFIYYKIVT